MKNRLTTPDSQIEVRMVGETPDTMQTAREDGEKNRQLTHACLDGDGITESFKFRGKILRFKNLLHLLDTQHLGKLTLKKQRNNMFLIIKINRDIFKPNYFS